MSQSSSEHNSLLFGAHTASWRRVDKSVVIIGDCHVCSFTQFAAPGPAEQLTNPDLANSMDGQCYRRFKSDQLNKSV